MDPHADLHLSLADLKARLPNPWNDAGGERDPHRPGARQRPLGDLGDSVEVGPLVGFGAGGFEREHHARDPSPPLRLSGWGRGDIVAHQYASDTNPIELREFARHVEIHSVPAVVPVQVEDPAPAVDASRDVQHRLSARRVKDIADGATVEHPTADVPQEDRQVAGSAAGGQPHLPSDGRIGAHDGGEFVGARKLVAVGRQEPFEHLIHEIFGAVEDLFHQRSRF